MQTHTYVATVISAHPQEAGRHKLWLGLPGRRLTLDIWLKSAKPSALLKELLPKGSRVPKGSVRSTNIVGVMV